jgi:hypothetical protein
MPLPQEILPTLFSKLILKSSLTDRLADISTSTTLPRRLLRFGSTGCRSVYGLLHSVHRGAGIKSRAATHAYEDARQAV